MRTAHAFTPFAAAAGRRRIIAILLTFSLFTALSVVLSVAMTARSRNQAALVEVAARQRTLAERYLNDVMVPRVGARADAAYTAGILRASAHALLEGGLAPGVNGDDDETRLAAVSGRVVRTQLIQERRLVADLTASGDAVFAHRALTTVALTAGEHLTVSTPVLRLRILAALTANVSLVAARTIVSGFTHNVDQLISIQVVLGVLGVAVSLLLGWALVAAARRQTAHFRSLVTSSNDLVLVFCAGACRYASRSVTDMLGRPAHELIDQGVMRFVHPDDQAALRAGCAHGTPTEITFRMRSHFDEWRHLEAHVTDLRGDRLIRGVVLNARDVTERTRLEEELTRQAFHDGLTGLANRALFRDRLSQALARSLRSQDPFCVLLVDLDGFKQVNDSLGHDAGDQLLRQVAARFSEVTRPADSLARLGGDEFAMLLEGETELGAVALADRLGQRLCEPMTISDREIVIKASIGIVSHAGGPGDGDQLIRHADVAMYAAKEAGRGRFEVFHEDMDRKLGELLGLEHEVRLGLERGEFSMHYQPEVDLESGALIGTEALMRWASPSRGSVPPADFIPIAESTGLIRPLGEFALRQACEQTARWRRDGILPEPFTTWVNLSGRQLSAGGVDELVQRALADAALPAAFLGLEITESAVVVEGPSGDRARHELQALRELGIKIAIDDFGTGFSALGQLRRFPVDVIKVDRSFVQGVEHNVKDAAITSNVVNLAHALGLIALAEGIETDGQLTSLLDLGCDQAQGYLFGRPIAADEMSTLLAARSADSAASELPARTHSQA